MRTIAVRIARYLDALGTPVVHDDDVIQLNVRIHPDIHAALKRCAFERQVKMRALVSAAIERWLSEEAGRVVAEWSAELMAGRDALGPPPKEAA